MNKPGATQVFLVRHGETAWSQSSQHTGHTDLPLTERGERRARHLGELLQGIPFALVLVSPLRRACRTCELAGFGDVARVEPNLSEWDYGDYEGRTSADIRAERPDWNVFLDGCPGGESPEQVSGRADLVIAGLRRTEGPVALFSHGQFLSALAARWIGLPVREGQHLLLDTASVSILDHNHHNAEAPAITLWNAASNDIFDLTPQRPRPSLAAGMPSRRE